MRSRTASAVTKYAALALIAAVAATSTVASAKHHHEHGDGGVETDDSADEPSGRAPSAADREDEAEDDAGAPVVDRTPAQAERRDQLVAKERALVRAQLHRSGQRISPRERQAIGLHWRHVMRLSRIREFAEQDHDTTLTTRVDGLLDRADKTFTARMNVLSVDGGAR